MTLYYSPETVARVSAATKVAENGYCIGWSTSEYRGEQLWETLYAMKGDVLISHTHLRSIHFNRPLWKWDRVAFIPSDAEYIGTYEMPTKIR